MRMQSRCKSVLFFKVQEHCKTTICRLLLLIHLDFITALAHRSNLSPTTTCKNNDFEMYFLEFTREIGFGVISDTCLYLYLLEYAKMTQMYLTLFWYKGFVRLKLILLDFLSLST